MSESEQILSGVVERVVFQNEENGWTVLDVVSDEELHKVVGVFPAVHAGEQLKLTGNWVEHPKFGRQFRAVSCEQYLPTDTEAVFRYLASGAIKGIGPVTASALVQTFGDDTLRIIEEEPERLVKVKGITARRAQEIGKEFREQFGLREILLAFSGYGLTQSEALRCFKRWGASAVETIRANPYLLCSTGLYISFERADAIAHSMAHAHDDVNRIEAGVLHVLRHNLSNGHTCLPSDKLVLAAAGLLQVEPTEVAATLQNMIGNFTVRQETIHERLFIFLPDLYQAEKYIASRIQLMGGVHTVTDTLLLKKIEQIEKQNNISYESQQKCAIIAAVERGALILTGGPGTGKTTTLRAIITLLESMGDRVEIAAPTGRAAKRMSELTGCEARTLHRLLEVQWDENDRPYFDRNEKNPLDIDTLIVDEVSMVDAVLFESLLRALKPNCRLILVGDTNQLPAVGAGSILHDLIRSNVLPVVELIEVFRQALTSDIVANAHRIVAGQMPQLTKKDGDFFFIPQPSAEETARTVVDLCHRRLPAGYGTSLFQEIQVLCPGRKGVVGTVQLNAALQELVNPPSDKKAECQANGTLFRQGDKVMHIKNDYDIGWTRDDGTYGTGVFNGDIGILEEISPRDQVLSVRYDDRVAQYTYDQAQELELAYAITVHKSQGSEFHTVVLPLFRQPSQLCYRNLLYTAVTRAKSLLVTVGSSETLGNMVANSREMLRYTGLEHFINQAGRLFE